MTEAVITGTYSDFKLVKTRSVAQIVIELPIEKAQEAVAVFGMPLPGSEVPVAVALLNRDPEQPALPKPKKHWNEMPRSQQAGILCTDERFRQWQGALDEDDSATILRRHCNVDSRATLDKDSSAAAQFDQMVTNYRMDTGQMAEVR